MLKLFCWVKWGSNRPLMKVGFTRLIFFFWFEERVINTKEFKKKSSVFILILFKGFFWSVRTGSESDSTKMDEEVSMEIEALEAIYCNDFESKWMFSLCWLTFLKIFHFYSFCTFLFFGLSFLSFAFVMFFLIFYLFFYYYFFIFIFCFDSRFFQ